jgi:hypothetical protein
LETSIDGKRGCMRAAGIQQKTAPAGSFFCFLHLVRKKMTMPLMMEMPMNFSRSLQAHSTTTSQ